MNRFSIQEAVGLQKEMAEQIEEEDDFPLPRWVGGMDVSSNRFDPAHLIYAAVVVLDIESLRVVETACAVETAPLPYIPGLLGFREAPCLIKAFEKLTIRPDLLMVDGHGISHPRRLGIASHIGVSLDLPSIGVAKSILVGKPAAMSQGQAPLIWKKKVIGELLQTKARANPLIISVGHRICLSSAIALVTRCLAGYRLPEPTRQAHLAANAFRRSTMADELAPA